MIAGEYDIIPLIKLETITYSYVGTELPHLLYDCTGNYFIPVRRHRTISSQRLTARDCSAAAAAAAGVCADDDAAMMLVGCWTYGDYCISSLKK